MGVPVRLSDGIVQAVVSKLVRVVIASAGPGVSIVASASETFVGTITRQCGIGEGSQPNWHVVDVTPPPTHVSSAPPLQRVAPAVQPASGGGTNASIGASTPPSIGASTPPSPGASS